MVGFYNGMSIDKPIDQSKVFHHTCRLELLDLKIEYTLTTCRFLNTVEKKTNHNNIIIL